MTKPRIGWCTAVTHTPGVPDHPLYGHFRPLDIVHECRVEPSVRSLAPSSANGEEATCPARFQFEREARDRCQRRSARLIPMHNLELFACIFGLWLVWRAQTRVWCVCA